MEIWQLLADLHPKLVQFPLVLLLAGLVFDGVGWASRSNRCHWAGVTLSTAGTVFLLVAFICGIYAEVMAGRAGIPQGPIEWHEFVANVASWGFVVLTAWRILMTPSRRKSMAAYVTIGLGFYVLLGITARLGGQLVFDYGAAVVGERFDSVATVHDLNTLAVRQTDENLKYSEMMHHIFGWITLGLSGSLLARAAFPAHERKVAWVGPTLMLVGGVFLFCFADLDLYRWNDLRQWGDREVELHKTIAVILTAVGASGLRRLRAARSENSGPAERPLAPVRRRPERSRSLVRQTTGKPIAVMALIGGGLLFTHVHTVAPYANVAAGVYIAHVVMGIVALSIGATQLLRDGYPKYRRPWSVAFGVLMCVESALLVSYNEGLPWYIGYGSYNRWGPHGGTVAPLGSWRAELTFDNVDQTLRVYALDRYKDAPRSIRGSDVTLLIDQGYRTTAVQMSSGDGTVCSAAAPWLRDVGTFSARLVTGGRTGFFDPWVTPVIAAVPPNEVAKYQCPMHDGVRSQTPGDCPICGMALIPRGPIVQTTMSDPGFGLDLREEPGSTPLSRRLSFAATEDGKLLSPLPVVHEHPLHVTVISTDWREFHHVHPVPGSDGRLTVEQTFGGPGDYVIFGEYMPAGHRMQAFRKLVTIGGPSTDAVVLRPEPSFVKPLASDPAMTAELIAQPRTLAAGTHCVLTFRVLDHGNPVTDLEPFMGAMGHCAVVSEDTRTFMHCHPEQLRPCTASTRGGPVVAFGAAFPSPGRYKIWGQFQRGGKVIVADFVVEVKTPPLPASVVNYILGDR